MKQVIEHALRHLALLAEDDPSIANALPKGWNGALEPLPDQPLSAYQLSNARSATFPNVQYAKWAVGVHIALLCDAIERREW